MKISENFDDPFQFSNEKMFSRENPYSVPDNYFETFSESVQGRIRRSGKQTITKPLVYRVSKYIVPALAASVFLIAGYLLFLKEYTTDDSNLVYEEWMDDYFDMYAQSNPNDYYDIMLNFGGDYIDEAEEFEYPSDDILMDYLIDYNYYFNDPVDIHEISQELITDTL